jgi:hypothetical protein
MKREDTIKQLLDKYLEGQTDIKEEKVLSDYFNGNGINPEWMVYKSMFSYFQVAKQEQSTQTFVPKVRPFWKSWHNMAAILMVAVATTFFIKSQTTGQDLGTYDDPELALQETIKAFDLIGDKLNSGKKEILRLNTLETTKTKYLNLK